MNLWAPILSQVWGTTAHEVVVFVGVRCLNNLILMFRCNRFVEFSRSMLNW